MLVLAVPIITRLEGGPVIKSEVDGFGSQLEIKNFENKLHARHGGMMNLVKPREDVSTYGSIPDETRLNRHSPLLLPRSSQPVQGTNIILIKLRGSDPSLQVRRDAGRRHGFW